MARYLELNTLYRGLEMIEFIVVPILFKELISKTLERSIESLKVRLINLS